jgi:peptide/nickel transport system substrate-binding protein
MPLRTWLERLRSLRRRLFFWLPSTSRADEQRPEALHDHALVLQVVEPERVPRWRQFRYVLRVMTRGEQRGFLLAFALAVISFGIAGSLFVVSRVIAVPVVGGTLTEALIGQPKYLNPLDALANDVDRDLIRLIYSGLFRFEGADAVPDLAESYSWSDDRKTLTVSLRKDARFHNGDPVTPEDVRFTFDSLENPDRTSPLLPFFRGVKVAAVDDSTLTFTLDAPDAAFLTKLSVGILPSRLWQDIQATSARLSDLNLKPIGSGPYQVKSFSRDSLGNIHSFSLERFDGYYGLKPYLKTLTFQFFGDRKEALDAFKADLVDALAFVSTADAIKLAGTSRTHDLHLELPQETTAFFNVKDKTLSNPKVRQALALAVNRADLVSAFQGSAEAVTGPYPFAAASTTMEDLERARDMLTDAGWVVPSNGNVRIWQPPKLPPKPPTVKKVKGKTVTVPVVPTSTPPLASGGAPVSTPSSTELTLTIDIPDDPDVQTAADALTRQWSLLGVKVTVEALPTDELVRLATRDRSTQVVLLNVLLGPEQDLFPFWWSGQVTDRGLNLSSFADRTLDDELQAAKRATSSDQLLAARQAITDTLNSKAPAVFLIRPFQHYLLNSKLQDVGDRQIAYNPAERFQDLMRWYVKTGWRWK